MTEDYDTTPAEQIAARTAKGHQIEERVLAKRAGLSLDAIVASLDANRQRATYGAVAGVMGTLPRGLMAGRPRTHKDSWIVAGTTSQRSRRGWPTGYSENQIHPECRRQAHQEQDNIIETPDVLKRWLADMNSLSATPRSGHTPAVPEPLPYDMGNAGDLVKHGVLAEFAQWWSEDNAKPLQYFDPFAGRPWVDSPKLEITRRIEALPPCAMRDAQPDPRHRYYGSSLVVANAAKAVGGRTHLWVSDCDNFARGAFAECGYQVKDISAPGFSSSDGFSVLSCNFAGDLVLIDPFADFLPRRARDVIPRIAAASSRVACALFVLNQNPDNPVGLEYRQLRSRYLPGVWSMHCPKLPGTAVRGEANYEVEVLLAWMGLDLHTRKMALRNRLTSYASCLSKILDKTVTFRGE